MKNKEVIYGFRNFLERNHLKDTNAYSNRWVFRHLLNYRATLVKRKKVNNKLTEQSYQTIPSFPLIEVNDSNFKCLDAGSCIVLRTKEPIPYYVDLKSITSPLNTSTVFKYEEVDPDLLYYKKFTRFPSQSNSVYYYIQDTGNGSYIYFWSENKTFVALKSIAITAIFYNPTLVQSITDCDGKSSKCSNFLEFDFKFEPELLTDLYALALQALRSKDAIMDMNQDDNPVTGQPYIK